MTLTPERLAQIADLRDWMTYLPEGPWFVSDCEGTLQVWREAVIRVSGRTEAGAIATYKTPSVYSRSDLLFEAHLDSWDHGMDEDDDVIRAVAIFLALARDVVPDLLAEVDRLTAERDSWKNATDATGLALGEVNRQRGEAQDRANAAEAEIARLTAALAACTCPDSYETYAGPEADCPVHGAVRALNEATAEIDALRQRADQVARAENLRDKWLSWPPGSEHYAAGLMLACYLDGTAYGSDEPRPEPGTLHPGVPGTTQITQSTQATTDADDGERP
jgi:hypothetical protein